MKTNAAKKWTCSDGKTRNAGQGPWVDREDVQQFLAFCNENGHVTRTHPDPFIEAHQVRHKGHWMGLIWNKAWKRFTADRRLSLLVQSFAAMKKGETA